MENFEKTDDPNRFYSNIREIENLEGWAKMTDEDVKYHAEIEAIMSKNFQKSLSETIEKRNQAREKLGMEPKLYDKLN